MIKFNETIKKEYPCGANNYGIVLGNETVVFIKTGRGGRIFGENDEQPDLYAELANEINFQFGYSVVVADNPMGEARTNPLDDDIRFIIEYLKQSADFSILYIGYSSGANYGAWYAHNYSEISNMLLLNPILNFNLHRTLECCERFSGIIEFAMGENDPSVQWAELISEIRDIRMKYLCGQGHRIESKLFINTVLEFLKSLSMSQ